MIIKGVIIGTICGMLLGLLYVYVLYIITKQ